MQTSTTVDPVRIDPHHLGPLDDRSRSGPGPGELFGDAERFLGKGEVKRRAALWNALSERARRHCAPDEHVLYVAPAAEKLTFMRYLALGAWAMKYHQVALVFTTSRVLEFLLEFDGKTVSERVRSFAWSGVATAKLSLGKLVLKPTTGKSVVWHVRKRRDRKLLSLLLPKIQTQLLGREAAADRAWPVSLCCACGRPLAAKPRQCDACGTELRSSRLASVLSLAFPGAGLFYAGHPVLGAFDLLGETVLFLVVASVLLTAGTGAQAASAIFVGLFLFVLTKLESAHIGHVLVERRRTETPERRKRWKRFAVVGGSVSALAVTVALLATGTLASRIDHDLDFASAGSTWVGSRNPADWSFESQELRSQWNSIDGWVASVFAYPLERGQTPESFRREFVEYQHDSGVDVVVDDESLPDGFQGFRVVERHDDGDPPLVVLHYFVHDPHGDDLHQMLLAVSTDQASQAESAMRDLLAQGQWIEATPPVY